MREFALFDSGSTTDSISPEFAAVSNVPVQTLEELVTLQLGCVGSRSSINYGTMTQIEVGPVRASHYFDIVNIDQYDAVLGIVFMKTYGIMLDFQTRRVTMQEVLLRLRGDEREPKPPDDETIPPEVRMKWYGLCKDLMGDIPLELPPLQEINHHINLKDENLQYNYCLPRCPEAMKAQLRAKLDRYEKAGWWER
ncbi:hypothetical protein JAAARDRAFT_143505 [Jaapia argillacea MUCL 33604]|uniref:Uncharacterized protein n=1 Tax=Jaapia argillacea MUCL 33604 TaxID=933084 RepID=A0A067P3B1_9AGAM|nr:hypothetical protein JAAARDRAFT_143505 [Jaapia argillacea MUCL 33604]